MRKGLALALVCVTAVAGLSLACDRPPSGDIREWTPADHDHADERAKSMAGMQSGQMPAQQAKPTGDAGAGSDDRAVVELTWRNQCASCHGPIGHGDGPSGPMVKAPDLTREDWQAKVTDAEIIATIKTGRNQMPRFDLSDKVLTGLAARIRASRGH